jgi:hypothetical protein
VDKDLKEKLDDEVRLDRLTEAMDGTEEQDWIDTHCGDCDSVLDEDGQCLKCRESLTKKEEENNGTK